MMTIKYRAKCGNTIDQKLKIGQRIARSRNAIMETDVPLPGEDKPVARPEFCDQKCLHRKKPERMEVLPGLGEDTWDGKSYVVNAYRCRFTAVEEDLEKP